MTPHDHYDDHLDPTDDPHGPPGWPPRTTQMTPLTPWTTLKDHRDDPLDPTDDPHGPARWPPRTTQMTPRTTPMDHQDDIPGPLRWPPGPHGRPSTTTRMTPQNHSDHPLDPTDDPHGPPGWPPRTTQMTSWPHGRPSRTTRMTPQGHSDAPLDPTDNPQGPPGWPPRATQMTPWTPRRTLMDHQDDPPGPLRWPLWTQQTTLMDHQDDPQGPLRWPPEPHERPSWTTWITPQVYSVDPWTHSSVQPLNHSLICLPIPQCIQGSKEFFKGSLGFNRASSQQFNWITNIRPSRFCDFSVWFGGSSEWSKMIRRIQRVISAHRSHPKCSRGSSSVVKEIIGVDGVIVFEPRSNPSGTVALLEVLEVRVVPVVISEVVSHEHSYEKIKKFYLVLSSQITRDRCLDERVGGRMGFCDDPTVDPIIKLSVHPSIRSSVRS